MEEECRDELTVLLPLLLSIVSDSPVSCVHPIVLIASIITDRCLLVVLYDALCLAIPDDVERRQRGCISNPPRPAMVVVSVVFVSDTKLYVLIVFMEESLDSFAVLETEWIRHVFCPLC